MLPRQCSVSLTHTRNSKVVQAKIGFIYLNKAKMLTNGLMDKELRICVSFNQKKEGIFTLNIRERIRMMGIRLAVITVWLADKDLRLNTRFWEEDLMQQVISHTYLSTYRSTLIRSCVILSHPSFLRVGRPFMDVVSWLCIRQLLL